MVELNPIADVGGDIASRIFSSILWFGIALVIISAIGISMWYFLYYRRKFDIKVLIKSERASGKFKIIEDYGAILNDKKNKSKYLRLFSTKVDLPVPPYRILQATNKGDLLEYWRKSEDEFIPLSPAKINKEFVARHDGKIIPIAQGEQMQVEGDIAYWNVKRKDLNKKLFDTENLLMKLLPFIPHILGGVFIIFILYIMLDSLPQLIGQLTELSKELKELKGTQYIVQKLIWPLMK